MYCRGAHIFQRSASGSCFMGEYARSLFLSAVPSKGPSALSVVLGTAGIVSLQVIAKQVRRARIMVTAVLTYGDFSYQE